MAANSNEFRCFLQTVGVIGLMCLIVQAVLSRWGYPGTLSVIGLLRPVFIAADILPQRAKSL
jgi:hypothetical protein